MADKYAVIPIARWQDHVEFCALHDLEPPSLVDDAVVIRRQDVFAAPALDAYANSILTAVELLPRDHPAALRLRAVANFFHLQASKSWQTPNRKIPD